MFCAKFESEKLVKFANIPISFTRYEDMFQDFPALHFE